MKHKRRTYNDKAMKTLMDRVAALHGMSLPRRGQWEIAVRAEPVSAQIAGKESPFSLTIIVDKESCFIFHMRVASKDEDGSGAEALFEAIAEHRLIPKTLLCENEDMYRELAPIAQMLHVELLQTALVAIPVVFREITCFFHG